MELAVRKPTSSRDRCRVTELDRDRTPWEPPSTRRNVMSTTAPSPEDLVATTLVGMEMGSSGNVAANQKGRSHQHDSMNHQGVEVVVMG